MRITEWLAARHERRETTRYVAAPLPVSREVFEADAQAVPRIQPDAWAALAAAAAEMAHRRLAEAMRAHGPLRDSLVSEARGMADLWDAFAELRGRAARAAEGKGARR